jgi:hypothetical protein
VADNPRDAGKTSGGGSLGHDQPRDVAESTPIRNQANERPKNRREAIDTDETDPVMPANDATLNTKI